LQHVEEREIEQVGKHRSRRGRVLVAVRPVQRHLEPVGMRDVIAERTCIARRGGWAAQLCDQKIGCGVVARRDCGCAEFADREMPLAHMGFGDRRMRQQIGFAVRDGAVEVFAARIDARERGADDQQLRYAAHQEAFVAAMSVAAPIVGIEHGDAQLAAEFLFEDRGEGSRR